MVTSGVSDDLRELASVAAGGGVSVAVDASPSRDRLARIAAMIRDAEQAVAVGGGRERRPRGARLIPLAPRRSRRRRLRTPAAPPWSWPASRPRTASVSRLGACAEGPVMREWLIGLGIAVGVMVASWLVLIVLARRLPEGTAKELARFLPACVTTVRRLRSNPDVPRRAKLAVGFAGLWVLSPIDLIPEFLPVIGPLDDVVVVALAFRYAARQIPRDVLLDAWPGDRRIIERLIGPARPTAVR